MKPLKLKLVTYVGGYQNHSKLAICNATIDEKGFKLQKIGPFYTSGKTIIEAGWDKIKDISISTPDNGRLTATRVLLTGVFALGLKKSQYFLVVKLTDGEVVCKTKITGSVAPAFSAKIANIVAKWGVNKMPDEKPVSAADELAKYAALTEKGVITRVEFEAKKKQLLK